MSEIKETFGVRAVYASKYATLFVLACLGANLITITWPDRQTERTHTEYRITLLRG